MQRPRTFEGIEEVRVETLGELVDRTTPSEYDEASGRLRAASVFRGAKCADWALLTSLDRLGGIDPPHTKGHLEEHILRNFIRYSRPHLPQQPANEWELLVTAQHHGLPTRLLDWTYSPLVAAHFATLGGDPRLDRVVWRLDWGRLHAHFDLPAIAFLVQDLDGLLRDKGVDSLWTLFNKPEGGPVQLVCMLDPPALDNRIVVQAAAFTISTDKTRSFDQILCDNGILDALTRYVIPAERINHIRDQLDLVTVDERRLFPDLDGVAAEMRRYYDASAE
ncbi:MAG TPA: FRG domain-containing protein [Longimicrobium sp.]